MSVEVVTVWAPRPNHLKWRNDYLNMIQLQRQTARHFGHRHLVVTDADLAPSEFDTMKVYLSSELMPAMIDGVIARLHAPVKDDLVFMDADAVVAKSLESAFDGSFDLGLTRREHALSPINNGAMYVAKEGALKALAFFLRARDRCATHWGADQEAISQEAAPVPATEGVQLRDGMRLAFLSMLTHNVSAKSKGRLHTRGPYVVHFKGEQAKPWAYEYASLFILR